jgi:hypothetical protein
MRGSSARHCQCEACLLSANGLAAAGVKAYVALELVGKVGGYAKQGSGLTAARLEKLQEGLVKLQAEGVAEGLRRLKAAKAAKAAKAQRIAVERRQAAKPPPTKRRRTSTSTCELVLAAAAAAAAAAGGPWGHGFGFWII